MKKLRDWLAALLAWLDRFLVMDEPPVVPPAPPEAEYHTMDAGQSAAVTKGPEYSDGRRH